jgi:hypothetical protein
MRISIVLLVVAGILGVGGIAGCGGGGGANRSQMLMRMAAGECRQIPDSDQRLRRQLNIANMQNNRGDAAGARATLADARSTIESSPTEALTQHVRISGWVSISELSREAGDYGGAHYACSQAVAWLSNIQPVTDRPQYIRGVAREVRALRGEAASAALLREGGAWAAQIADAGQRRAAYIAIANDLFTCEDFDGGKAVLHRDEDVAWRVDTLTQLSGGWGYDKHAWGKSVSFQSMFYEQQK